ncbi:MAG TPA: hypothetical protein VFV50_09300 [Bdellovibrionales bacterium]|nr:hypothetical protein [Bdellovibrionales bacterium]
MAQDEGGSQGAAKNEILERDIRILFVTQKESALASTLRFLGKRGWKYSVVETMKEAFDLMSTQNKPTHVLLSFTLPINHRRMEYLLKNTFNVVPILYSEVFESTTYSMMRKTGFEHAILSPVSGPTVQMKVRNISNVREQTYTTGSNRSRSRRGGAVDDGIPEGQQTDCTPQNLPSSGYWQQVPNRTPPFWKFSSFEPMILNEQEGIFYFEGAEPPQLNAEQKWETKDPSGRLFFIGRQNRQKREKRRNWWERIDGEDAPVDRTKRERGYKFVIAPVTEDEQAAAQAAEALPNYIHVKGKGAEQQEAAKSSPAWGQDTSRIIIRESFRPRNSSMIINPKGTGAAAFEPVDANGKVHPFFEREDPAEEEFNPESAAALAAELEQPDHVRPEDVEAELFKGTKNRHGMILNKGEAPEAEDAGSAEAQDEDSELSIVKGGRRKRGLTFAKGSIEDAEDYVREAKERERKKRRSPETSAPDDEPEAVHNLSNYRRKKKGPKWDQLDEQERDPLLTEREPQEDDPELTQEKPIDELEPDISGEPDDQDSEQATDGADDRSAPNAASGFSGGPADAAKARGLSVTDAERAGKHSGAGSLQRDTEATGSDDEGPEGGVRASEDEMSGPTRAFGKIRSILAESSMRTLEELAKNNTGKLNEIRNTSRVGVISVKTETSKGVLLVALGDNKEIGSVLLADVKSRLIHHLKMRGQDLGSEDDLEITIEQVDFIDWGKVETEFLALDQFGDDQLGIAFLPGEDIIPEASRSAENHMLAVDMECIVPDIPITFDIYVYLPVNKKYIRYVKKGQRIDPKQVERLLGYNNEHFHIAREDLKNFKAYCAANYINVRIKESRIKKAS